MAKTKTFARDEVYPSWFPNAIQEYVSTIAANLELRKNSATAIEVPAGAASGQVSVGVDGRWRYRSATVTRSHPGGAAGTYDVYVVAADQNIVNTPLPFTDATNYAWDLRIVASGATPPISAGVVDVFRKIGEVEWDGAAITDVIQTEGPDLTLPARHRARRADETPLKVRGFAAQTVDLLRVEDSSASRLVSVDPSGKLLFGSSGDTNLYRATTDTLGSDDTFRVQRPLTTDLAFYSIATGDTAARLVWNAGGNLSWGPGNATQDSTLTRAGVGIMQFNNRLQIAPGVAGAGLALSGQNWGDTANQSVIATNSNTTSDAVLSARSADAVVGTTKNQPLLLLTNSASNVRVSAAGVLQGAKGLQVMDSAFTTAYYTIDGSVNPGTTLTLQPVAASPNSYTWQYGDGTNWNLGFGAKTGATAGRKALSISDTGRLGWHDTSAANASPEFYLTRSSANVLMVKDARLNVERALGTDIAAQAHVAGEANNRWFMDMTGAMSWGAGGASAPDTNLSRSGASALTLGSSSLTAGSFAFNASGGILSSPGYIQISSGAVNEQIMFKQTGASVEVARFNSSGNLVLGPARQIGWSAADATGTPDTTLARGGANSLTASGSLAVGGNVSLTATGAFIQRNATAAGTVVFTTRIAADTQDRFFIQADGGHAWGPGGAALSDTNLYRSAADYLRTDDDFSVGNGSGAAGVRIDNAGLVEVERAAGGASAFLMRVTGDTQDRFALTVDGVLNWGPGGAVARDTNLYRQAASILRTDDTFEADSFAIMGGTGQVSARASTAAGNISWASRISTDTVDRFEILADGTHKWGAGGAAALDTNTNLYRSAANVLKTDGWFISGTNSGNLIQLTNTDPASGAFLRFDGSAFVLSHKGTGHMYLGYNSAATSRTRIYGEGSTGPSPVVEVGNNTLGFYGATPAAQDTGWGTPLTEAVYRTPLTASSTPDQVRRYVETMAQVLKDRGLLGA